MIPDDLIEEMVGFAIEVPFNSAQPQHHQRSVGDLTITCYLSDHDGHLSLSSQRTITGPEKVQINRFLARWHADMAQHETKGRYDIVRFIFDHPLTGTRIVFKDQQHQPQLASVSRQQRRSGGARPENRTHEGPRWQTLREDQCHICHRQLTDPLSRRVRIGSVCRSHIEAAEGNTAAMWDAISPAELARLWSQYNIYDRQESE